MELMLTAAENLLKVRGIISIVVILSFFNFETTYVQSVRKLVMTLAAPIVKVAPLLYVREAPAATEPHIPGNKH